MSPARLFVTGILAGIFRPLPKEKIWQWAERCLKIPNGAENTDMQGQPWSSGLSPYVRDPMEWFRKAGKASMMVRKSSQVGFTQMLLIVICWYIVNKPTNIGYYIDSAEEARKISKARLKPWIRDNHLLETFGEETDELSNMTYFLKGMMVHLLGTHAKGVLRNKQLGVVILDEVDAHPKIDGSTTWDVAPGRIKKSRDGKRFGVGSPNDEDGPTETAYQEGTQEQYFVPCPHCGHMQPLIWSRVRFSGPEFEVDDPELELEEDDPDIDLGAVEKRRIAQIDLNKVLTRTWYECEMMGCRIEHGESFGTKYQMLLNGEWRVTNPKAPPNNRSLWISDLYSNFVTWGEMAVEFIAAQKNLNKLRAWVQERLGEPFRLGSGTLKDTDILRLCLKYNRGTCPIDPVMIGLLVDVQQSSFKWMLIGYSRNGDMYVIDWGEAGDWEKVRDLAYQEIPIAGGKTRVPDVGLIDEGDGNRTKEVRAFTLLHPHLFPVKGRSKEQMRKEIIYSSESWLEGVKLITYHINDHVFKSELLFSRIKRSDKAAKYNTGGFYLPRRITEELVDELLAEKLEERKDRLGFTIREWIKKGTNDWLDCGKYGCGLWTILEPSLRAAGTLDEPAGKAAA